MSGRAAGPGLPRGGRLGSADPGAAPTRAAPAAGPLVVSGGRLRGHRPRRARWPGRCVLAVPDPAERARAQRGPDRRPAMVAAVTGPPGRLRGPRVPADVAGRTTGAADRLVPSAFAAVPPDRGDDHGAFPGRSAAAAVARTGPLQRGVVQQERRERTRLLPHALRPVAQHGHHRPAGRRAPLAAHLSGCRRRRPDQPAGTSTAGGPRGAARTPAANRRRSQGHRRVPAGGLRRAAPPAGRLDRRV